MKNLTYPILAAATLSVLTAACGKHETESASSPVKIEVAAPVEDSVLIHKTYPGTLRANREVDLMARVDGYLVGKDYTSGDYVKAGTVLFRIEDRNYRDAVQQAQATLATAQADLKYASARYAAMVEALKGDAVSEMEVAQAKSNLAESEAAVKTAEAALQTANTQLSYCTVRAPFDGHVTTGTYDVGAYVGGAASPVGLASIYDDSQMVASISIEDAEALGQLRANIEAGLIDYNNIPISFSEPLKHDYTASLNYLSPSIDTSTGTILVQALVQNPYHELQSGMYITLNLPVAFDSHAILIKDASIATDQLGKYVYLVNDSDKVVYTPITIGELANDTMRIVSEGISLKDRYVTKALLKVRDGMVVDPVMTK